LHEQRRTPVIKPSPRCAPGQSGERRPPSAPEAEDRPGDASPAAGRADPGPWRVCVPVGVLDARTTYRGRDGSPLGVRGRLMLLILDGYCRNRPYCWARNEELAAAYGCEVRAVQLILRELEGDGLIVRVAAGRGEPGRIGIVLRVRADPRRPAADSESALRMAILSLMEQREGARGDEKTRAHEIAPGRAQGIAPQLLRNSEKYKRTFNVAAPSDPEIPGPSEDAVAEPVSSETAPGGEGDTPASGPPPAETPPAVAGLPASASPPGAGARAGAPAPGEPPPAAVLAEALGPYVASPDRSLQGWQLVERLTRRGVLLELRAEGDVRVRRRDPGVEPPGAAEWAALRWLKAEVVAELHRRRPTPPAGPAPGPAPGGGAPAPRVKDPAAVRRMIGRLAAGPAGDDSDCRRLARRLVEDPGFAHGDEDLELSGQTYLGWARDVKSGKLAEGLLIAAFEEACRPGARNRGSALVAAVKRRKAGAHVHSGS
jgi:hypothetical protein